MLKRRIIPVELLVGDRLVKTVKFGSSRDVGDPLKSSQVYSSQDADEIVLLNIDRKDRSVSHTAEWLRRIVQSCFMPIAVGGGIVSVPQAAELFAAGADKVIVNSAAYRQPELLQAIASRYGSQALVVSIDVTIEPNGSYALRSDCGRQYEAPSIEQHIAAAVSCGAGEILINSIDRDGTMSGYDLALLKRARSCCPVPLIVCGGAGHYLHLREAFADGADAVACGSLFNFGDNNPLRVKSFLKNYGIPLKRI